MFTLIHLSDDQITFKTPDDDIQLQHDSEFTEPKMKIWQQIIIKYRAYSIS